MLQRCLLSPINVCIHRRRRARASGERAPKLLTASGSVEIEPRYQIYKHLLHSPHTHRSILLHKNVFWPTINTPRRLKSKLLRN